MRQKVVIGHNNCRSYSLQTVDKSRRSDWVEIPVMLRPVHMKYVDPRHEVTILVPDRWSPSYPEVLLEPRVEA